MVDLSEFSNISPYSDVEASEALSKLADYPVVAIASKHFFPTESQDYLKNLLKSINTIDEFQVLVMQETFLKGRCWPHRHMRNYGLYDRSPI